MIARQPYFANSKMKKENCEQFPLLQLNYI